MNINRRTLITSGGAAVTVMAAGGTWWALNRETTPKGASSRIDLLAGAYAGAEHETDPQQFVMLSLVGGMPNNTSMDVRVFDLEGASLPAPASVAATLTNLITGESTDQVSVTITNTALHLEQDAIQSNGWWQLRVDMDDLTASWTFLMPDPNLTGFETPPAVETDPDAEAMLSAALNVLVNHTSMRWWQWLSGGNGAIILSRFSITTPASNGMPPSFESDSILAGRIPLDGSAPRFQVDNPRSVTVGDEAMRYGTGSTPEAINPVQYLPLEQYDTTYDGHDGVHFGMTAEIDGRTCQLVTFHLPQGVEAWLAFWIDIDTLILRELFMVSVNHYMHWVYYDIDEPFELAF